MKEDKIVEKFENFVVVENLFAYQIWDGFEVKKHYLVIPKNFTETISSFSPAESKEYFEILAKYESKGLFDLFTRTAKSSKNGQTSAHAFDRFRSQKTRSLAVQYRWENSLVAKFFEIVWLNFFEKSGKIFEALNNF